MTYLGHSISNFYTLYMSETWRRTLINQLESDELTYEAILNTINLFRRLLNIVLHDQAIEEDRLLNLSTRERFGTDLVLADFDCTNPSTFIEQILTVIRQTIVHLRHPQLYHQINYQPTRTSGRKRKRRPHKDK